MVIRIVAEPFKKPHYEEITFFQLKPKVDRRFFRCPHCNGTAYQEADGFIVVVSCLNCGYNKPIGVALCTQTV